MILFSLALAAVLPVSAGRVATPLSGEGWTLDGTSVSVPHTWNALDAADGEGPMNDGWGDSVGSPSYLRAARTYARDLPAPKAGRRYFVRCEGVSSKAILRVNGREAGRHNGAFTAFCFEVTDLLGPSDNRLEIVADNTYDPDVPPVSGDFVMFGGIYRDVWLIETAPVCISPLEFGGPGVSVETDPDTGRVTARLAVLGGTNEVQRFAVPNYALWSPENPKTYTHRFVLRQGGFEDAVDVTFGFRKAEFRADGFYLNGKKRQIRGVCRHQDREGKGWAVSAEDEAEDVTWMKRMGADGVRTAHYPQSTRFFDLCDRKGLLVWTELPLVELLTFTPAFRTNALAMAREMVAQHRNHPSVILWGVSNEIFGNSGSKMREADALPLLRAVYDAIKQANPARAVVSASCHPARHALNTITDVQGFNIYPGWYDAPPWYEGDGGGGLSNSIARVLAAYPERGSVAVSEYGAGASVTQHDDPLTRPRPDLTPYPEEYQAYLHAGALLAAKDHPRVWGVYPWVMFDLAADRRREADRFGINNKGLVTYDRKTAKDAFHLYKANWNPEPELHLVGARMREIARDRVNVMAFSNVGDVTLSVNGRRHATQAPDRAATCLWRDVPLDPGENEIEIAAGELVRRARWRCVPGQRLMAIGFDDFRGSDFSLVEPLFRKYGATATYNNPPGAGGIDARRVRLLEAHGNEVGDHTWFHWNGLFDDPRMNGQDPAAPEGGQVPFPSNDELRADRGDGRNAFGFPLTDSVNEQLHDFWAYGSKRFSAVKNTWGRLTDEECQRIRNYFAVYSGTCGFLDTFDRLSNRYLGTTGRSRGSWNAEKGCYTGGIFTGCRTSANHEIWERVLQVTRAAYRESCRTNFSFATWSWPGSIPSPFLFEKDGRFFYDAARTLPANALARFPSSLRRDADGKPLARSFTEALRSEGYKTTHDMTYPSRRDGTAPTAMRRQLFANAGFTRRDALAYSTERTVHYDTIAREYSEAYFGGNTNNASAKMYDDGGSFRAFVEAVRHETASGLVHGEVIDSVDTFSERIFLDRALAFCRAAGVRVCSKREAYEACFARTNVCGNLIRNATFRNSAAEFLPGARKVPTNPDGYLGACHVEMAAGGRRTLVTEGAVTNIVYGVPTGELVYSVRVHGTGKIRILALRNRSALTLEGLETLSEIDVSAATSESCAVRFAVPDAPETAYEPRWEGLGDKVMGLVIVYAPGLWLGDVRLMVLEEK